MTYTEAKIKQRTHEKWKLENQVNWKEKEIRYNKKIYWKKDSVTTCEFWQS